ncbi:TonB-dependent receptor [Mucilaginibacter terrae]|uniref:Ferric enterobactin receptor n=1 Tax=Mucilaginibacter terrae TaxID=1955052 RepID=A0ABU3GPQ6_9SPHI|nr:TonB-dependent receptor [Mucilaginibacter terrae]MDT3401605.1 ferric enterobactin receptor [Mucilaginibacter terrae]
MKRISTSLVIVLSLSVSIAYAQQTKQVLKKQVINHFFTCTMDKMLDTISMKYKLPIFYEREVIEKYDVNARFFNETLMDMLKSVCSEHSLRYWIENDGTVYIMERPDDLVRLRRLKNMRKNMAVIQPQKLEAPNGPPQKFKFAITGRVTDQNTGEALPGAIVKIRNSDLSVLTNSSGNFTIMNVPTDTSVVEASFMGYQNDAFRLTHQNIMGMLTLSLFPNMNNTLNEVEVVGKKAGVLNTDSKKVSVLQLTPAALDKLPSIGERDIMRSFQLMPGVSATNESSSGAYVRGGTPDQNLVTFDGFTVYQVDHLYGFFSAFNTNAVRDVDLYKGGYTAKYGGRLSSVTEIRGKDGNKNETNIGGDLGLLSTNIYAETPVGSKSTALVAFRRSYQGPLYDKIFGQFNTSTTTNTAPTGGGFGGGGRGGPGGGGFANQTTPSSYFYDVNAKYTFTPSTKNSFSWSLYNGTDHLDNGRKLNFPSFLSTSSSDLTINDNLRTGNLGTSLKWTTNAGQKLFGNTVVSYSGFYSDRNRGTTGSVTDSGSTRQINNGMVETNRLNDYSIKSDWEWRAGSKAKLLFGGYGSYLRIKYNYLQNDTIQLINQNNSGTVAGAFTELEYDPSANLHIQPGLRTTYFTPTGKFYTEPRLSATYDITNNFKLKGATGRFYQFTKQVTREDVISGDRNFWVLANNTSIPVAYADHFIGGFSVENDNFLFDVEGYYKRLRGLSEYSIRQVGGNTGGQGMMMPSQSNTTTVTENFYNGEGYSRGIEMMLQKKAGVYTGWLSYTLGEAKSKFPNYGDSYFSSNQDIRHEFKWVNMYHLQRWSFSAVFIFSTGHPYTAPLGSYTINTLDGNQMTYMSISAKNGERLPAYHRLDLSATYDLLKIDGRKVGSISFSLFNAYNHVNTWYNDYYLQGNQIITTQVKYLGLTPNITLSLKLK